MIFFINFLEGISGSDKASKPVDNIESGCYCNDPNFPILCYCDQYGFQVMAKTLIIYLITNNSSTLLMITYNID